MGSKIVAAAGAACALLTVVACGDSSEPAPASQSTFSVTASQPASPSAGRPADGTPVPPATGAGGGHAGHQGGAPAPAPTKTVTMTPTHKPTDKPGGEYDVPCTGPDQGTICTNPNHGAGTNPNENGQAPTATTRAR